MKASARARSNIALVKYWGKRNSGLNLPAVGSISITLDQLWSDTTIEFSEALTDDDLILDGERRAAQLDRVSDCLDILRLMAGTQMRAKIVSKNNFPTAAGLASSASGFAALVAAANAALDLKLSAKELSVTARRGSGSAARSIFGGFVDLYRGERDDGLDCYAEPLLPAEAWPLEVVVAVTARGRKSVGSGPGMNKSASSSAYYPAWVDTHPADLVAAREAIAAQDFERLAQVSESSCLKMHAAAIATEPALLYWNGVTVECMHEILNWRRSGIGVFFTIDAGPQIKAICMPGTGKQVAEALSAIPGVHETILTGLGPSVEVSTVDLAS